MRSAFAEWLTKEANEMNSILVTGDLGFGVFEEFRRVHPGRFINAGVAEQSMIGMASGLSTIFGRVFVYSIGNFASLRCLEQIRNDVAYMNLRVTVVSVGSGFSYGSQGYTHHAIEDISALRAIPNLFLYQPADIIELESVLTEIKQSDSPSFLRLGRGGEPKIHEMNCDLDVASPLVLSNGRDGHIFFSGPIGFEVEGARQILAGQGIFPSIYSCPRLSPNYNFCDFINFSGTSVFLVVEEHVGSGALMSSMLESLIGHDINLGNFCHLSIDTEAIHEFGDQGYLRKLHKIDSTSIAKVFKSLVDKH